MKWNAAGYESFFQEIAGKDHLLIEPERYDETYYLIHGFGSSVLDLMPHAQCLASGHKRVVLMILDGHTGVADYAHSHIGLSRWYQTVSSVIDRYGDGGDTMVIGFSMGGLLALKLTGEYTFKGIACISTFVGIPAKSLQEKAVGVLSALNIRKVERILQLSHPRSKREIAYFDKFSVEDTTRLTRDVEKFVGQLACLEVKVLFFHACSDLVSDYQSLVTLCRSVCQDFTIIPFHGLKHFLQFDMPPENLLDAIDVYFSSEHVNPARNPAWEQALLRLYASVETGCVTQDRAFIMKLVAR